MKMQKITGRTASMGKKIVGSACMANGKDTVMTADGILVAEMTDPSLLSFMAKSKAVVTSTGGLLCHAAIVCRELGIPCVVAAKNVHKLVKQGSIITVDPADGSVTIH